MKMLKSAHMTKGIVKGGQRTSTILSEGDKAAAMACVPSKEKNGKKKDDLRRLASSIARVHADTQKEGCLEGNVKSPSNGHGAKWRRC